MAAYTQDDGFHEIQLNGKQLVFLFMAATVVSVVIFLCGVLVGRGVRAQRGDFVQNVQNLQGAASTDLVPAPSTEATRLPGATQDPPATPPPPVEDLSYFNRLEKPAAAETLGKGEPAKAPAPLPPAPARAEAPRSEALRAETSLPEPARSEPARGELPRAEPSRRADMGAAAEIKPVTPPKDPAALDAAPAAPGYAVQVAALNVKSEAEAMVKRLSSKGYSAYILPSANGTPAVYRVRVGAFKTRREAEALAARLQKEEQITPWVTR